MKRAIYPGSFDPLTNGHMDIIKRARQLFDEVYISIIHNPAKKPFFSFSERKAHIEAVYSDDSGVIVKAHEGLLVDFAREQNVYSIIRGLRAVSDFDYEFQLALTNRKLEERMNTVFFMTDEKYSYLSSSLVKELASYKADIHQFVPKAVELAFKNKHEGNGA
jgi:pantetheine-phosphate adenylyltransferase